MAMTRSDSEEEVSAAAQIPEGKKPPRKRPVLRALKLFPPSIFPLVGLFLIWQWGSSLDSLAGVLPSATDTIAEFWRMLFEPLTWLAVKDTLQMAIIGLVISVTIAIPLGIALGLSKFAFLSSRFTLNFLRVIPGIVVVPLATLVLGPTMEMGIFVVAWPILFVVAVQTAYGVRDADPVLIETLKCYRQGVLGQIRYARLPAAAPQIAYGLRIAVIISFLAAVTAGIIGGAPGMGREMMYAQLNGQTTLTFAIVLQLGFLGMLVSFVVEWAQPKLIFWVPS
jgi:ABC-type nitrate/sulfonate/bicarbonate transport system permease component